MRVSEPQVQKENPLRATQRAVRFASERYSASEL
jgi:hypothetical protein